MLKKKKVAVVGGVVLHAKIELDLNAKYLKTQVKPA